ncbi:hypothetical protein ONZ45_g15687 [Pleurotus djamor]|nr:hypothetical protein ONZ45_g15687 [Pleurotus djamor]
MGHVCSFRHALALDEWRVKFQPEFANGGLGPRERERGDVKEVWFPGTHSDVGGGSILNRRLKNFGSALRWITYEAMSRGLFLKPFEEQWTPLSLTPSLKWFWRPLELLPVLALDYKTEHTTTLRLVQPGQRIHQSVFNHYKDSGKVSHAKPPHPFADWTEFFDSSLDKINPFYEPDPFHNVTQLLKALKASCNTENPTFLSQSLILLQSYLETNLRQASVSINEVPEAGDTLLFVLQATLRNPTSVENPNMKETLIQLISMVKNSPFNRYQLTLGQVRQWGYKSIRTQYHPDLVTLSSRFAYLRSARIGGSIGKVAYCKSRPNHIVVVGRTSASVWDGTDKPPRKLDLFLGRCSAISTDGDHIVVALANRNEIAFFDSATESTSKSDWALDYDGELSDSPSEVVALEMFSDQALASIHEDGWIKLWTRRRGSLSWSGQAHTPDHSRVLRSVGSPPSPLRSSAPIPYLLGLLWVDLQYYTSFRLIDTSCSNINVLQSSLLRRVLVTRDTLRRRLRPISDNNTNSDFVSLHHPPSSSLGIPSPRSSSCSDVGPLSPTSSAL